MKSSAQINVVDMKISPQTVFWFHQEARRQLISLDLGPRRKVVEKLICRTRSTRTQKRSLNLPTSLSLRQTAPAPVPEGETISFKPPLQTPFSSWEPYQRSSDTPTGVNTTEVNPIGVNPTGIEQCFLGHLPLSCPGCGALTQEVNGDEPGFYARSRRSVREYIKRVKRAKTGIDHDVIPAGEEKGETLEDDFTQQEATPASITTGREEPHRGPTKDAQQDIPFCDRCHNLLHQSKGVPIAHPTIDSIADIIAESPFRRNHVYHVLDAADFPLSLIPSIFNRLMLARPRSQNRRSQHDFSTRTTVSFIITRSDLLAPQKEMVDSLMPYFTSVLREALGRKGQDMRLGNVHLVSAKRGWWTKEIKEAIYARGGGNWMVGKFNVGKSNLFEVLFPKGHNQKAPIRSQLQDETDQHHHSHLAPPEQQPLFLESSLLPPPQPSTPYPILPLVSPLSGTTASPIRLPFGPSPHAPRGELIDLPGLPRSNLCHFVPPTHHRTLLMEHRPTVTQHVLKPGQSLLLGGGLMRITPVTTPTSNPNDQTIILAYPFTPLPAHVTSTEKAEGTQRQTRESGIETLLVPEAGPAMKSAGVFALDTDVTRSRSGALLRAGVPMEKLPFRVRGTDLLLEGVGWVELVCQVRHRRRRRLLEEREKKKNSGAGDTDAMSVLDHHHHPLHSHSSSSQGEHRGFGNGHPRHRHEGGEEEEEEEGEGEGDPFPTPLVEVFTPEGASVGQRRTMGAWMLIHGARKPGQKWSGAGRKTGSGGGWSGGKTKKGRPRKSMKGVKKNEKRMRREGDGDGGGGGVGGQVE